MSIYNIEITKPAENNLCAIGNYIANQLLEPDIAKRVINKIGEGINKLQEIPFRYSLVVDERLAHQGIRKFMIDNYIIFCIVTEEVKTVTIIRILYNKRNWMNLI